jgi:peptidoglycan/LPS O-acetylase OafA/YrhL
MRKRLDLRVLVVPGAAALLSAMLLDAPLLFLVGLGMTTIGLGACGGRTARTVGRYGDPSYGLYICSFPIMQALVGSRVVQTPWSLFSVAFPLSLAVAYASWHFVESPAMRRTRRRAPVLLPESSSVLQEAAA